MKNVMGSAWYAIPMSDLALLLRFATNAILGATKADVLFVGVLGSLTLTTARSAPKWKRTGMGAQRLLILDRPKRIYFMNGRSMVLKSGDHL